MLQLDIGDIARSPRTPAPLIMLRSTVSAWSSDVCPSAMAEHPASFETLPRNFSLAKRAASSKERFCCFRISATFTFSLNSRMFKSSHTFVTKAESASESSPRNK